MMLFTDTTFIGVDPTAGQKPVTYAALDNELRLLALGQGGPEDILAFLAGQSKAMVAVCAPRRPNSGIMRDEVLRNSLNPQPAPGRWEGFRLAEYLLRQYGIRMPRTPDAMEACANWVQMGFYLFRQLEAIGYAPFPDETASRQVLEVYPHACFTVLLERLPFTKYSLEGRLQRQLLLHDRKVRLRDPMLIFEEITRHRLLKGMLQLEDLLSADELDAVVAAYTAWLASTQPHSVTRLGDPSEGEIVLPAAPLHNGYQ